LGAVFWIFFASETALSRACLSRLRIAWIGLSRNRFLRVPCSGVHSLGRLFGSIHEAAAMKFPQPDEGGGSNLAKFPRMAGNSL